MVVVVGGAAVVAAVVGVGTAAVVVAAVGVVIARHLSSVAVLLSFLQLQPLTSGSLVNDKRAIPEERPRQNHQLMNHIPYTEGLFTFGKKKKKLDLQLLHEKVLYSPPKKKK